MNLTNLTRRVPSAFATIRTHHRRTATAFAVLVAAAIPSFGQTAPRYLITTPTTLPTPSTYGGPNGNLATDQFGDLFVPDAADSKVLEFPANGSAPIVIFNASATAPQVSGVAVDSANNLYVTTRYDSSLSANETDIFKFPYSSGYPAPYTYTGAAPARCTAISTSVCNYGNFLQTSGGYYQPQALGFDAAGNGYMITTYDSLNSTGGKTVYACDVQCGYDNDSATIAIAKFPTTATSLAVAPNGDLYLVDGTDVFYSRAGSGTVAIFDKSYESQYGGAAGVGFDRAGNLYVSNSAGTYEVPYINGAITASNKFQVAVSTVGGYTGPAVDNNGNVYSAAYSTLLKSSLFNYNFGSSALGTAVAAQTFTVTFEQAGTITSLSALQGGVAATEFTLAAGTCVPGAFAAGSSCTFTVSFTPSAVGTRRGSVVFTDSTGFQTVTYLLGVGTGTGVAVDPGTPTVISSTLQAPSGIAIDNAGNVFVADATAKAVYKYAAGMGIPTTIGGGYTKPTGVATDGGGNVYVVDQGAGTLLLFNSTTTGYAATGTVLAAGLTTPTDVVVSGTGAIYVSNTGKNAVAQYPNASRIGSDTTSLSLGINLSGPTGLSLDAAGDLFIADTGNNRAVQLTYLGSQTAVGSGLLAPTGVAAEASGAVLVADQGNGRVVRIPNEAGTLTTADQVVLTQPILDPFSIRVSAAGNLYVTDNMLGAVDSLQRTAGTLNFGISNVNSPTPAQTVVVSSTGTMLLTLGSPFFVAPLASTNFTLTSGTSSSACAAGTLGSGSDCVLSSVFDPTSTGTKAAVVNFNISAANAAAPSITLTGQGVQLVGVNVTLTQTSPTGAVTFGVPVVLSANVASSSASSTAVPTGSVIFNVDGQNSKPVTLVNGVAKFTLTGLGGNTNHSIIATYTGGAVYASGSSSAFAISVQPATLAATVTVYGDPSALTPLSAAPGDPVSFSVAIVPSVMVSGALTGTVSFVSGKTVLGTSTISQNSTTLAYSAGVSTTTLLPSCPNGQLPPNCSNIYQVQAVFTGNGNYSGFTTAPISLTIVAPTYSVVASNGTITSTAAQYGTSTVTISSYSGYQAGVALSCNGLPANAYCIFRPGLISLTTQGGVVTSANGTTTTTPSMIPVQVTTMEIRVDQNSVNIESASSIGIFGALTAVLLLGLGMRNRRNLRGAITCVLLATLAAAMPGCGGSSSSTAYPTPAGTFPITLVATASPLTSSGQPPSIASIATISSANGVVLATFNGYSGLPSSGTVVVAGVSPAAFNGTYTETLTSVLAPGSTTVYNDQITYTVPGIGTTSGSGGFVRASNLSFTQPFSLVVQ